MAVKLKVEGEPQERISASRAAAILCLTAADACATQEGDGNSTIIVPPVRGSAITRCMSESVSILNSSRFATTR